MARDDELRGVEDVLRSGAVWAQLPADLEQRVLDELRSPSAPIVLAGTALMPAASAEGAVLHLVNGVEISLRFSGIAPAEGFGYQAWLGDGIDVRSIGSFRLPDEGEQVVLRPGEAPAGAMITVTRHSSDDELRTSTNPILTGQLPR